MQHWSLPPLNSGENGISTCVGTYLLSGFNVVSGAKQLNNPYQRIYSNLPAHVMIYFTMSYWAVDSWNAGADYFQLALDSKMFTIASPANYKQFPPTTCGNTLYEDLGNVRLFGRVNHQASTLTFKVITQFDQASDNEAIGIRDINLLFVSTSSSITENICEKASITIGTALQCSCIEGQFQNTSALCQNCHSSCASCFNYGSKYCYECSFGYGFDGTRCVSCSSACSSCNGKGINQCNSCKSGYLLFNNNTCISANTCIFPMSITGCNTYCEPPCGHGLSYYYEKTNSCIKDCSTAVVLVDDLYFKCSTEFSVSKLLHPIRYLDVDLPENLQRIRAIRGMNIISIRVIPSMFKRAVRKFTSLILPDEFYKSRLSSSFLVNFVDDLVLLGILLAAEIMLACLQYIFICSKFTSPEILVRSLRMLTGWNLPLMLIATNVGDVIFFASLEFRRPQLNTGFGSFSYTLSIFILVMISCFLIFVAYLSHKAWKIQSRNRSNMDYLTFSDFAKKWRKFQVIFGGCGHSSAFNQPFFLVYTLRLASPMIIAAFLYKYPFFQSILYTTLSVAILVYLCWRRPIKSKLSSLNLTVIEVALFIVNLSIVALSITTLVDGEYKRMKEALESVIIAANYFIDAIAIFFLCIKSINILLIVREQHREKSSKVTATWLQLLFIPFQQGGMSFEQVNLYSKDWIDVKETHLQSIDLSSQRFGINFTNSALKTDNREQLEFNQSHRARELRQENSRKIVPIRTREEDNVNFMGDFYNLNNNNPSQMRFQQQIAIDSLQEAENRINSNTRDVLQSPKREMDESERNGVNKHKERLKRILQL